MSALVTMSGTPVVHIVMYRAKTQHLTAWRHAKRGASVRLTRKFLSTQLQCTKAHSVFPTKIAQVGEVTQTLTRWPRYEYTRTKNLWYGAIQKRENRPRPCSHFVLDERKVDIEASYTYLCKHVCALRLTGRRALRGRNAGTR